MTIELQRYTDPTAFCAAVDDYLHANVNVCSQLFAFTRALTVQQVQERDVWMVRLQRDGQTCGVALINSVPPIRLVSVSPLDDDGAALLAQALAADHIAVDGVLGNVASATTLARHIGLPTRERVRLGNHVLDTPPLLAPSDGQLRAATMQDLDLIIGWERAFVDECNLPSNHAKIPAEIKERLSGPTQLMWLWEVDGNPVAMVLGRPSPPIARVGMVYTEPAYRGRGYAGALVANVSAGLQAQGCGAVFLFTDLANPTSNGVYRRIGYRLLDEFIHLDVMRG